MHELSLVEGVVDQVTRAVAADSAAQRVVRVRLAIGRLVAVVPDAMRFCFDVCTRDTLLEGAALEIDEIAGRGRCRACAAEIELHDPIALCRCGSADVEIVAGEELLIREVEVI